MYIHVICKWKHVSIFCCDTISKDVDSMSLKISKAEIHE